MGSTRKNAAVFFLAALCRLPLYAQAPTVLFSAEMQSIEKKLSSPASPAEKNRALRDLARLLELSGDLSGAAKAWNEAAQALPADYDARVKTGAALAATGEFDRALSVLAGVPPSGDTGLCARYLSAQIAAFRSGQSPGLSSLLADPAFSAYKPGIYYSIWKISGDGAYRARLLNEFPHSPEALSLQDGAPVAAAPTALWLLGAPGAAPVPAAAPNQAAAAPVPAVRGAGTAPAPAAGTDGEGPVMLQAGLFGREENARTLAGRLRAAGFVPVISPKTVNGTAYWAVGVSPGRDHTNTIILLKDAGFEAFPVY
ncbi:MAG: SPOR domain-containing protein [Treponema sp.]|jgi:cell division septation protein DedD|nr:SPOR domain-containing protein [Treponema sp.]